MKKKHIIILVILVVAATGIGFGTSVISKLAGITIADVDLSEIADGTCNGSYSIFPVAAEVRVTVKDQSITAIELVKHNHGRGEGAEVIPARVLEAQSLDVDTVSGATYSSNVILKAIESALTGTQ